MPGDQGYKTREEAAIVSPPIIAILDAHKHSSTVHVYVNLKVPNFVDVSGSRPDLDTTLQYLSLLSPRGAPPS
jgi:hypothetical protein